MANIAKPVKIALIMVTIGALLLIVINLCDHFSVVGLKTLEPVHRNIFLIVSHFFPRSNTTTNSFNITDEIAFHYNPDNYILILPFFKIPKFIMLFGIFADCITIFGSYAMLVGVIILIPLFTIIRIIYDNGTLISIILLITCVYKCLSCCYDLPDENVTELKEISKIICSKKFCCFWCSSENESGFGEV